jgi:4-aminobutyrate aminotransferase
MLKTAAASRPHPHLKTELPGPKGRAMIERDHAVVSPSYPRDYPFVMSHGHGTEVWDVDGNRFLDFMAGIAVCATGHAHPEVVRAVQEAAGRFLHISSDYWHEQMVSLAERLARLAPVGEPAMSFFCQSGTEAVEGAIKLARYVTGRPRYVGFLGGFHGRTMGSLAFTSSKYTQQKGFAPTMPGVTHVPYPNPYRPLFVGSDQGRAVLDYLRMLFERNVPPSEVAAILVEPLQGEGGYIVPPQGFLAGLRELCDEHGILLIFDEVQSGIGRTGRMFACEHEGVAPDIMTLAKGLGSGLPIGAVVARKRVMEHWKRGAHGNTYGGNPIACAAANATLDLVAGGLAANAADVGAYFMDRLRALARDFPCIGEVRGRGLMIGMELIGPGPDKKPAPGLCDAVITRAYHNGLLLLSCGVSTVRFMPPLCLTRTEVDEAIGYLTNALDEALNVTTV